MYVNEGKIRNFPSEGNYRLNHPVRTKQTEAIIVLQSTYNRRISRCYTRIIFQKVWQAPLKVNTQFKEEKKQKNYSFRLFNTVLFCRRTLQ